MIGWFARNGIAANLLMIGILLGGTYCALYRITLEMEPDRDYGAVYISKYYPGATPRDVQKEILIPVENALDSLDGVKKLHADAYPSRAKIKVEAKKGADIRILKDDIESRLKTISTIPAPNEPFRVDTPSRSDHRSVIWVVVTGDLPQQELQSVSRRVREDLLTIDGISRVREFLPHNRKVSIEVNVGKLAAYDLSFQEVSNAIRQYSVDLPAGTISGANGRLVVSAKGQAHSNEEFSNIPLRASDGSLLLLKDVANVTDHDRYEHVASEFNRRPAVRLEVARTGRESALDVARKVREYVATAEGRFPEGIKLGTHADRAISLESRLGTMASSLLQGAVLVLIVLGLFLRPQLAFWVVVGIPVSFAGGVIMMEVFGISANMMSLFGFIIVIGVVVDDAIVTGESVYSRLQEGAAPLDAAIEGTKRVTVPVTFGVLTTIVAFLPLLFFDGSTGELARQIPFVVTPVLLFSLVESKFILPSHLKHLRASPAGDEVVRSPLRRVQRKVASGLQAFIDRIYSPCLNVVLAHRFTAVSLFLAMGLLLLGYFAGGRLGYVSIPSVERPELMAQLDLPEHVSIEATRAFMDRLTDAAEAMREDFIDPGSGEPIVGNTWRLIGTNRPRGHYDSSNGVMFVTLMPPGLRSEPGPDNDTIIKRWRELIGEVPSNATLRIRTLKTGGSEDDRDVDPLQVDIRGPNSPHKEEIARQVRDLFREADGVAHAYSTHRYPQNELELSLKPRAAELGINQQTLASQVRQAFYGVEAQRILRGRDEYRVMVRLPDEQRESLHTLELLKIRTPKGAQVPLSTVADFTFVKSPTFIERNDKAEVTRVGGEPVDRSIDLRRLADSLRPRIEELLDDHEELSYKFTGAVQEAEELRKRFIIGIVALMFGIYALLAIPFRSVLQPIYVLIVVPFGVIGAMLGHIVMDITPSDLSLFGVLAMAGVVVNDSLVMVDDINQRVRRGIPLNDAVRQSGARRFRPIFLTSATTFVGLVPLMFDNSLQAQFLIPMAVSLAFGVLFATAITLFLVPSVLLVADDFQRLAARLFSWYRRPFQERLSP
jgi:multidrug efflux pump subunit AcrB